MKEHLKKYYKLMLRCIFIAAYIAIPSVIAILLGFIFDGWVLATGTFWISMILYAGLFAMDVKKYQRAYCD